MSALRVRLNDTKTSQTLINELIVFCTKRSSYFAHEFIRHMRNEAHEVVLRVIEGSVTRKEFDGGEQYLRLNIEDRQELCGRTAVFIGSTDNDTDFLELLRIGWELAEFPRHP